MHQWGHYNHPLGELDCLSIENDFGFSCENRSGPAIRRHMSDTFLHYLLYDRNSKLLPQKTHPSYLQPQPENADQTEKRSVLCWRSISAASALCAATVVMFVVFAENPRSHFSATFLFVLTISKICPTIFIIGNKRMGQYVYNQIKNGMVENFTWTTILFRRYFERSQVGIAPQEANNIV